MKQEKEIPCTCGSGNLFNAVPPEIRPRTKKADGLTRVTCSQCGTVYSTNREEPGLCFACRKKSPNAKT